MFTQGRTITVCFTVLVLSATVSIALDPAPNCLRYVIAVFRHGIRSPMAKSTLPNDPNKERYMELAAGRLATLTTTGKHQMFAVGQQLKERYGSLINGYHKDKVAVSSTRTSRTIMSALTVMAAMFPPSTRIFRNLKWQPTPVRQNTDNIEKSYVFRHKKPSDCPRYSEMSSEAYSKFNSLDTRQRHQRLYDLVRKYGGNPDINTPSQLYYIYDTLHFAQLNGLQLPAWATIPQRDFNNRPIFPDLMLPFLEEYFQSIMYYKGNEEMLNVFSGPLLDDFTSKFLKIANNPSVPERFWYHSTHDTTIYPLLRGLKVDDPLTAEPGDGVLLELHVENNEHYVKMFMYDSNQSIMTELHSPLCSKPCTLAKFTVNIKGLTPRQWDELCNK